MSKIWNWQQADWPRFSYEPLSTLEEQFLLSSGALFGVYKHIKDDEKSALIVNVMSTEALKTSEIEGEYLNRASLQSSIQKNLGLATPMRLVSAAEQGISDVMVDLYKNFAEPLSHKLLFKWHSMITSGRTDLDMMGAYRTHTDAMQVVSGPLHKPTIHFETPPSSQMPQEMDKFIAWFNASINMPALTRAAIAHLYFVCIHPFEDGNGRIGRALVVKSLAQSLKQPMLIALSQTIEANRKAYYAALEDSNKSNRIDRWVNYFADVIIQAQAHTATTLEFLIEKSKFYDRMKNLLNSRQSKVIERIFREGPSGFKGGLSAENYIKISRTSRATATRDLNDLVEKQALTKTGVGKGTRYQLVQDPASQ